MGAITKIQWADSTINFWDFCTPVSAGCKNCYASTRSVRLGRGSYRKGVPRIHVKGAVASALALNRKPWICNGCGTAIGPDGDCNSGCVGAHQSVHRRRIFTNSLSDWLDNEVPVAWLVEMLDTIERCDKVMWILCTKRLENFTARLRECVVFEAIHGDSFPFVRHWMAGDPPKNVILLASVEDQQRADERIPELLNIPAACRGLSIEPLLGPIDLRDIDVVDWLIIGGESGPKARPCNVEWVRSLVRQGKAAGVEMFVKQLGAVCISDESTPDQWPPGTLLSHHTEEIARVNLRDPKGGDPSEWPEDLRVQEWPKM